jgi:hypothetical protein
MCRNKFKDNIVWGNEVIIMSSVWRGLKKPAIKMERNIEIFKIGTVKNREI